MPHSHRPRLDGLTAKRAGAFAAVAAAAPLLFLAFLTAAGAFNPERLAPERFIDALEARDGVHDGFRRAHSKGVCAVGSFTGADGASALSRAALFRPIRTPVAARFSTGGGLPQAPDGRNVFRSMALQFESPGGEEFRMAMNHVPIFIVSNPATFPKLHRAHAPDPATGKPDPDKIAAFFAEHPETQPFRSWMGAHDLPSSFANAPYYSAHAFRFIDAGGGEHFVKWRFEPDAPRAALDKSRLSELPRNYLFDDFAARLKEGPARWTMIATLAAPGDVVDDPTVLWPEDREEVVMGVLTITALQSEADGACRDVNFDPLILPDGVKPTDDPVLFARSAAYSVSLTRRLGEGPQSPAFSPDVD